MTTSEQELKQDIKKMVKESYTTGYELALDQGISLLNKYQLAYPGAVKILDAIIADLKYLKSS